MKDYIKKANTIGVVFPDVLFPNAKTDMSKWATVACDQYTSQPDYWNEVSQITKDFPSAAKLMLPEIYLNGSDADERIEIINNTMDEYIKNGILESIGTCAIVVKRNTKASPERTGVLVALDLEKYDFSKDSGSLIRATEGTVTERIPPRMKIRKNASLEMPHIMILIDDPDKKVIEPLAENACTDNPLYDFELMQNGGHIKGFKVTDDRLLEAFTSALLSLADKETFKKKYNVNGDTPVLLFAVGDGNHSLASAKCHWEEKKKAGASENDPARYAMAEIINVHDAGIIFEPIHRVLFNADIDDFTNELSDWFGENASIAETDTVFESGAKSDDMYFTVPFSGGNRHGNIYIDKKIHTLAVGAIQPFIDSFLIKHPEAKIDYVHGNDVVNELAQKDGNIGIFLPPMEKSDLFLTVIRDGALPRKTFSMGEAFEKRYYIECRKIKDTE